MKRLSIGLLVIALTVLMVSTGFAKEGSAEISSALQAQMEKGASQTLNVLVSTTDYNYGPVIAEIEAQGGSVYATFEYAKGLAAALPASSINAIAGLAGVEGISMDAIRTFGDDPQPLTQREFNSAEDLDAYSAAGSAFSLGEEFETVTLDTAALPDTYYGYMSMNTTPVWAEGNEGQDSLVVVIDTGVYGDHFMLAGSLVGGIDLSTDVGTADEGYDLVTNHYHGTHVGGIIAGHGAILLPEDDPWVESYEMYTGMALQDFAPGIKYFPLLGTAPAADLYAVKVFPHTGAGAPTSTIIAGIEHAIGLKVNGEYDVDVINMSLGGANLFDGRDLEDQVVDYATSVGITMVVAASNDGPSSMTIASPGTANTSITTGAVAHPVNTRFFWDYNYGAVGIGSYLFVDDNPQIAYFSSRGPTVDGRDKPTASAVGVFVLSAFTGSPTALGFASGTSMATPGMAGVVALLNTYGETVGASPYDYKQAVLAGSHFLDGFADFEQGAGFIDAEAAMMALMADSSLGDVEPTLKNGYSANIVHPAGEKLSKVNGGKGETFQITDLAPGYVEHFYLDLHPNAEAIIVEFSDVDYGYDPLGMNSFEVHLTSAITSSDSTYYFASVNVWGDATFVVEPMNSQVSGVVGGVNAFDLPLMPGYVRLTIENDWTSFDDISGTVTVKVITGNNSEKADESYSGKVNTGESYGFFPVGFGPNGVDLQLSWEHDWSKYPTSDLDMVVAWFDTDGNLTYVYDGATLNSPEFVSIDSTEIGAVYVLIDGYDTNGLDEMFTLEVDYK